ncbi:MAG: hypothetical protein IJ106_16160 [Parasporobacterium sp.]|nr:hypothetical protein [Parasporobacterium sp.]MBQ9032960.1 hypothetical protein [Parasporobacterium sp.]
MYKCPNCGGEIEFLPESGKIRCPYCDSEFSPEEIQDSPLDQTRKNAEEQTLDGGKIFTCSQCGAALYTTEETGVTFCSFCGSQAFLESRMKGEDSIFPDLVIPFHISEDKCKTIYKDKIKHAWFLPGSMKSDTVIDKFRGIYMPCWIYTGEADADGDYNTSTTTRDGSYDIIKKYNISARAHGVYGGFTEDASSSFPDSIMEDIAPFPMKKAVPFNDKYLAGFYADIGNVPPEAYNDEIFRSLDANIRNDLSLEHDIKSKNVSSTDLYNHTSINGRITKVRKGFLPVWFLSNKNERTGLMSYAVVNGLTGKIHTDLPVDFKKYLLISLLIALPIFLVLQFFTMKPDTLLIITMLLLSILMFFSTGMLREKYIQEHGLNDIGLLYLNQSKKFGQHPDPAGYGEYPGTAGKRRAGSGRGKRILFGFLCFIGIPFLCSLFYVLTDINVIALGFIAGVLLFIILITGKSSGSKGSEAAIVPKKGRIRVPFPIILRAILLPLIGVVAGLLITIWSPHNDLYYYGAVLLCCVMLILTVLDFVRITNRLALRKPAQLGKRGGDERD